MNSTWSQRFLWSVAAVFTVAAAGILVWGIVTPIDQPATPPGSSLLLSSAGANTQRSPSPALPPLQSFAQLWQTDVRQRLGAAEASSIPQELPLAPAPPTLRAQLVGTAVEGERPYAVFYDEQQHPLVCTIGQLVDGLRICGIDRNKVTLQQNNQRIELTVPQQFGATGGRP